MRRKQVVGGTQGSDRELIRRKNSLHGMQNKNRISKGEQMTKEIVACAIVAGFSLAILHLIISTLINTFEAIENLQERVSKLEKRR
jgi:hypothetical protein